MHRAKNTVSKKEKLNLSQILIGVAIGDAFGAGVEFQDRHWIRANVDFSRLVNARHTIAVPEQQKALFTQNYHPWDYTDDTEMTIGLLKALCATEPFSEELLIRKWKEEYDKGVQEKGYGRNGHGSMGWYYTGEKTIEEIKAFQRNRKNPGNAPAMRAVPLGLIREDLINTYAAINANATHPNINAILASQCIARSAEYMIIKKGDPEKIIAYCGQTIELNDEYQTYLSQVDHLPPYEALTEKDFKVLCGPQPICTPYFLEGINGVPSDAKYTTGCVLYILKNSTHAMDALKKSVYLGGDVDSVASITTGIMAGVFGLASIPGFMIEQLEGLDYLLKVAEKFEQHTKTSFFDPSY
ncbi:MAG: ADP-ribosylglycohydrolase family protein [Saprospiraceae bacterium]